MCTRGRGGRHRREEILTCPLRVVQFQAGPTLQSEEPVAPLFFVVVLFWGFWILFVCFVFALHLVSPTGSILSLNTLGRGSQLYSEEPWVPLEMPQSFLAKEK